MAYLFLTVADLGWPAAEQALAQLLYLAVMYGSAAACLRRGALWPGRERAWLLIGVGVLAAALAQTYLALAGGAPAESYPQAAAWLFFASYAGLIGGLRFLIGRLPGRHWLDTTVAVLGLATLWSWLVFEQVLGAVQDGGGGTAVALAYPVLDLLLAVLVLAFFAGAGWRPGRRWTLLGLGLLACVTANSLFSTGVGGEHALGELVAALWPLSALLAAMAAWTAPRGAAEAAPRDSLMPVAVSAVFAGVAVLAMVVDHFQRVHGLTLALSCATLIGVTARVVTLYRRRLEAEREVERAGLGTVSALASAVDAKDHYTRDHSERVGLYAEAVARALGLDPARVSRIAAAGKLHDVGKIAVSDHILRKPDPLTFEELEELKSHSQVGERIARAAGLTDIALWIRHHHERWDGLGYPDGLAGEATPLESRIIGAAEALDAMTSTRSYTLARTPVEAVAEFAAGSGGQFDPGVAACVVDLLSSRSLRLFGDRDGTPDSPPVQSVAAPAQERTRRLGPVRTGRRWWGAIADSQRFERWAHFGAVLLGLGVGLKLAFPMHVPPPGACPAPQEGLVMCQLNQGLLRSLTIVVGAVLVSHLLTLWSLKALQGRRKARRRPAPPTRQCPAPPDDSLLVAATCGFVNDARRPRRFVRVDGVGGPEQAPEGPAP